MNSPLNIKNDFLHSTQSGFLAYIDVDTKKEYTLSLTDFKKVIISGANYFYNNLGLKKGDTISYLFENCPEIIALNLICFFTGLKACPLDAKRDTKEVALKKMQETNTKAFFFRKEESLGNELASEVSAKSIAISDFSELFSLFSQNQNENVFENFDPNAISLILYTSGTTGFPKGAELAFSNLFYGAKQVAEWFKINSNDVFYLVLPLHHINSTIFTLATLFSGGSLVISSRYSKSNYFKDAARFGATMSSIVPTINIDLLEEEENFNKVKDQLKFKYIQIGSAPVSAKNASEFVQKYGIKLIQGYGSTETSLRVTGVPVDASNEVYQRLLTNNSIGEVLSQNEVYILNDAESVLEKEKEEGEICVKGKNIMQGYLNRPEETEKALKDGLFHTGDVGYFEKIEGEKYYFLKGRIKELIIKGGINISPLFIEERLREQVSWARDVIVVGFPHYRFGEEIGVIFIPKNADYKKDFEKTVSDLKNNKIKNLNPYEIPKIALIANDSEIAKTATGKVQHIKVRDDFKDKFLSEFKLIGENKNYLYRLITPDEEEILKKAIEIHNSVFPTGLQLDFETMLHRARNGFVIGTFEKEELVGVLTGFFGNENLLQENNNWSKITGESRFTTSNPKGKVAVLCSAASISSEGKKEEVSLDFKEPKLTEEQVLDYINQEKDYVVRFHKKPKAGFDQGAEVYRIILNGNPDDKESLGTVVMFAYPSLSALQNPQFTTDKIGVGLVEAAIKYAKQEGKEKAIALSRLGEAYKYLR